jgi:N-acetylneuraminic acid mutarotase
MQAMRTLLLLIFCLFGQASISLGSTQWQQRADFGNFGRHRGAGIGIGTKGYAGLGHLNGTGIDTRYADWWEFDPATNAWAQKADYPGNNGNGDQDVVAISTETLAFIGMGEMDENSFYKFDPQANLWTQVSSPPITAVFHNLHAFSIGHKGYFPALFSNNFFEYDTDTDTWTMLNILPFSTSYGIPTFSIGDKGYIKYGTLLYEYNPATDSWTPKAAFPGTTPSRPKAISQYNQGFIIGGLGPAWEMSGEVWRYSPTNDTWTQLDDFPGTKRRWAIVIKIGERVYYGLGTNGINFNDFWEFNSVGGIEEYEASTFKAYPNPAIDHVNFTSEESQDFEIVLYDAKGASVASTFSINGKARLERKYLPAGTYTYHVMVDGESVHSDRIVFM